MTKKSFGVEDLNIIGDSGTPLIESSTDMAIKVGTNLSRLGIGDADFMAGFPRETADPNNITVVNCGILTANKIFGQVVGTGGGSGGSETDKIYVTPKSDDSWFNLLLTEKGDTDTNTQISAGYKETYVDDEYIRCAWNPYLERLYGYKLQTRAIYDNGGDPGNAGQVLTSGGTGEFSWENSSNAKYSASGGEGAVQFSTGASNFNLDDDISNFKYIEDGGNYDSSGNHLYVKRVRGAFLTDTNNTSGVHFDLELHHVGTVVITNWTQINIPKTTVESWEIGNTITIINSNSTATQVINPHTDVTLVLAGGEFSGPRTLKARGVATIIMIQSNLWVITGMGLS